VTHDGGWRRHSSRYLFQSRWYNVRTDEVELPAGRRIDYTVVEHPGFALIVPILPDGSVLMIRVFRYPVQADILECPSGSLDGEAPEIAARRELLEETGFRADRLEPLGSYYASTGVSDERFHVFLAPDVQKAGTPSREDTEQMELVFLPLAEAVALALSGGVLDAPSALALILAGHRVEARPR
jgi:ADP-ribose pyrophosphatase